MSRRRGYRELQADAARGTVTCPHCNSTFAPLDGGRPAAGLTARMPSDWPQRTPEQRAVRIEVLRPQAERLEVELRRRVGDSTYQLWLAPVRLVDAASDRLYFVAPPEIFEWVAARFLRVIEESAGALAGRPISVVVATGGAS